MHLLDDFDSLDIMQLETKRYSFILAATEQKHLLQSARIILNSLLNLPGSENFLLDHSQFSETGFINGEALLIERLTKTASRTQLQKKIENRIYNSNPQLYAADFAIEWQKSRLAEKKAAFYPTLDLDASVSYNHYLKDTDFFKEKKTGWEIAGQSRCACNARAGFVCRRGHEAPRKSGRTGRPRCGNGRSSGLIRMGTASCRPVNAPPPGRRCSGELARPSR